MHKNTNARRRKTYNKHTNTATNTVQQKYGTASRKHNSKKMTDEQHNMAIKTKNKHRKQTKIYKGKKKTREQTQN